jgi:hypothetical protein
VQVGTPGASIICRGHEYCGCVCHAAGDVTFMDAMEMCDEYSNMISGGRLNILMYGS